MNRENHGDCTPHKAHELDWFWSAFAPIASAPGGVARVRELILSLAVQGRLVPQDAFDEPAPTLLKRIAAEKARLVKAGEIRKSAPLAPISEDETPFDLPKNWAWTRLGEIGDWGAGATPNRAKPEYYGGSISWFKSGELNDRFINSSRETITTQALKECSLRLNKPGDVLIAMYGATIGKVAILEIEATTNQAVCACTCFEGFFNRYLFLLLLAYRSRFQSQGAGGAQPNISREKIIRTVAPLPPLAEQQRIVARVDELMARCDELEALQARQSEARAEALRVSLARLLDAPDAATSAARWGCLSAHWDELFDTPASVAPLRQTILGLAVRGQLVPQDEADEPASHLLKQIAAEKARLVKAGELRKSAPLPPISADETPFDLPESWAWVRLGETILLISGQHLIPEEQNSDGEGLPYLTGPADFGEKNPTASRWTTQPKTTAIRDDILLTVKGAGVGKINMADMKESAIGRQLMALRPFKVDLDYLYLFMSSSHSKFQQLSFGMTVPGIGREHILELSFPLPPLAEQRRIVARVDELMTRCDALEAGLRAAQQTSEALGVAAVRQLSASTYV